MNFKVAGSSRASDYINAGKQGAAAVRDAFIAARKSSPDYGGLGEVDMKARSEERQTMTEVSGRVAEAGLRAMATTKRAGLEAEAKMKAADKKASATRMAGLVGGLGLAATGGFLGWQDRKEEKREAERDAERQGQIDDYISNSDKQLADLQQTIDEMRESRGEGSEPVTVQLP